MCIRDSNDLLHNLEEMHAAAGSDNKDLWIYEASSLRGTDLFDSIEGPDLTNRLLDFIAELDS
ncbi:MAG: hypothetical protein GYB64_13875, partial [Chloroflexi bacterium]|nr:hypothetical protein [Chloroflexota bacterium]